VSGFVDDVTSFVEALGYNEPGIILSLAQIPWESDDDRNQFIEHLKKEVQ
jgi:hypothetical protein